MKKIVLTAVLVLCSTFGAQAQTQKGAYDDMVRMYQALLQDPNLDPQSRAQITQLMNQMQQSSDNMSSPIPPSYLNYPSSTQYAPAAQQNADTSEDGQDNDDSSNDCDGCADPAQ